MSTNLNTEPIHSNPPCIKARFITSFNYTTYSTSIAYRKYINSNVVKGYLYISCKTAEIVIQSHFINRDNIAVCMIRSAKGVKSYNIPNQAGIVYIE